MVMQRVLVAGASGYLGRFVVKELKERGYWVRILVRHPEKLRSPGSFLEPAIYDIADDIFVGQITKPETLTNVCDGIDAVFSSVGITRQREKMSYMDIDYQANKNLLDIARQTAVRKFVFVHIFNAPALAVLDNVKAKQLFVEYLQASGIDHSVVCPNGFFSDMSEFLWMAKSGKVFLIGDGTKKINPIHGADLAKVCADAISSDAKEISAGGPAIYTYEQIGEVAFSVTGKTPRVFHVPVWLVSLAAALLQPFRKQLSAMLMGLLKITQRDCVAPGVGIHTLESFYAELWTAKKLHPEKEGE